MDWLCPNYSIVMQAQLALLHGSLSPASTIKDLVPIVQTGDLHVLVYDLTDNFMYVANARGSNETGPNMAYDRQFVRLNMTELFELQPSRVNSVPKEEDIPFAMQA